MIRVRANLEEYSIDFHHTLHLGPIEPDDFLEKIWATVTHTTLNDETADLVEKAVGEAILYYADWDRYGWEDTPLEVFDRHSGDLSAIYSALYRDQHATIRKALGPLYFESVLVISHLRIVPEHRSNGLGSAVLRSLIDVLGRRAGIIAVQPHPIDLAREVGARVVKEHPDFARELKRVERFYRRAGFRRVPGKTVMYLLPE